MKRLLPILIMLLFLQIISHAFGDEVGDPIGWHWYNYNSSPLVPKPQQQANLNSLNPTEAVQTIKTGTQEALNAAVLNPSEANVMQYLVMQQWITNQSSLFAAQYPKVLLDYPALDPRIQNPTEQIATQMVGQKISQDQRTALKNLSATNGVLFFYQGGNQLDELMCKVMAQFVQIYQLAIIPISVDGQVSEFFPNSKIDQGQAQKLGIQYFPAVILVNPTTQQIQPVSYGFLAQDEILQRFLLIANNFKPTYLGGT